jgi:hypothetical protein
MRVPFTLFGRGKPISVTRAKLPNIGSFYEFWRPRKRRETIMTGIARPAKGRNMPHVAASLRSFVRRVKGIENGLFLVESQA